MSSTPDEPRTGSKRPAEDDQQPPAQRRRIEPQQAVVVAPLSSLDAVQALAGFSEAIRERSLQAEDGSVQLTGEEVQRLSVSIEGTVQSFLSKPATTEDMLLLLGELHRVLPLPSPSPTPHQQRQQLQLMQLANTFLDTPREWAAPPLDLPADVIVLILEQLRDLHAEEQEDGGWAITGNSAGWREIKILGHLSRAWGDVCYPLYRSELHINETRSFPKYAKLLRLNPVRASALTRLYIRVFDFEFSLARSTSDEGFSLPDLITHSPNLTTLSLASDRSSSHSPYRRRREASTFAAYIGGVELPALICSKATKLRTLVYGAPCTMEDIAAFTTELPDLRSLDITGDVDPTPPPSVFKPCVATLRRFWAPSTVFTIPQLNRLVASSTSLITALAFTFDLDDYWEPQPAPTEKVEKELRRLEKLFERIGPTLKELLVMSPMADAPEPAGRLRMPGGGQGNGNILTMTLAMVGGPLPAGVPPPPGAPAPAPAQAQAQAGAAQPVAAQPAAPQPAAAPANPAPAPQPRAARRHARPNAAAGGAAPNANGNNNPLPFFLPFGAGGAATPATPFFETILTHTPRLRHLELYGRRYSAQIVDVLKLLDQLEWLSMSVPEDEEKDATAAALLEWTSSLPPGGSEKRGALRRLELSGRGGDWGAKERRSIKQACEDRGVAYASTDVKS